MSPKRRYTEHLETSIEKAETHATNETKQKASDQLAQALFGNLFVGRDVGRVARIYFRSKGEGKERFALPYTVPETLFFRKSPFPFLTLSRAC